MTTRTGIQPQRQSCRAMVCISWAMAIAATIGCDLPSPSANISQTQEELVSKDGRGGYNWNMNAGGFEVLRIKPFPFLNKVDRTELIRNYELPQYEDSVNFTRPEWMNDEVFSWYRRFSEPQPQPRIVFELEKGVGPQATVAIDRLGTKMLVASEGLAEWDLISGTLIKQHPLPIQNCRWMEYDLDGQTALMHNEELLVRVKLADGKVIQKYSSPSGKLLRVVKAREADVVALTTSTNEMFAVSDNLSKVKEYKHEKLATPNIAIHPSGKWVLGLTLTKAFWWMIDEADLPMISFNPPRGLVTAQCFAASGKSLDRWGDPFFFYEKSKTPRDIEFAQQGFPTYLPTSVIRHQAAATFDGSEDWMATLCAKGDFANGIKNYIQDLHLSSFIYSEPCEIPFADFQLLAANWSWEKLAFRVGNSIKVVERRAWVDHLGFSMVQRAALLLSEGNLDTLEKLAALLRNQKVHQFQRSGEQLYSLLVAAIGDYWATLNADKVPANVRRSINQWERSASELATLCSAYRHMRIAADVQPEMGKRDTATGQWQMDPAKIAMFESNLASAQEEMNELLDQKQHSAALYALLLRNTRYKKIEEARCQEWLVQSLQKYPDCFEPVYWMCVRLLPRTEGNEGDAGALIHGIAELYAPQHRSKVYMRAALFMYSEFGASILENNQAGISISRLLSAGKANLQHLYRSENEALIAIAKSKSRFEFAEELARSHNQRFGLVGPKGYDLQAYAEIAKAREKSFPAVTKPKN